MHPEAYFAGRRPTKPPLPKTGRLRGFRKASEGQVGELDHRILLKQYLGEERADELAPAWRGARYELLENRAKDRAVLRYASEWENESRAAEFFKAYVEICKQKPSSLEIESETASEVAGKSGDGNVLIRLEGTIVSSVEGLPEP
jgi:hypothetical protein